MQRTRTRLGFRWLLTAIAIAFASALPAFTQGANTIFGGLFEVTILTNQTAAVTLESMALGGVLGLGSYTMQLDARFNDSLFDSLSLSAAGPLGEISLNSSLAFNPSLLSFQSWQTSASFQLLDLALTDVLYVTTPQSSSYNLLSASVSVEGIAFQGAFKVGICPLSFWETSFCGNWTWFECDAGMSLCVQFSDIGFRSIALGASRLVLFEDVFGITGTLSASIVYGLDEKTFTPTLQFQPEWFVCPNVEILAEVTEGPVMTSLAALSIYGIRGECDFKNGISFSFAESFDATKHAAVTGKADFFERFGIEGPLASCCGSPGAFDIDVYFSATTPGTLFRAALVTASFAVQITENFSFSFAGEYPMASSDWEVEFTFRVFW